MPIYNITVTFPLRVDNVYHILATSDRHVINFTIKISEMFSPGNWGSKAAHKGALVYGAQFVQESHLGVI